MEAPEIKVGTKIFISTDKRPFTVRACDDRYAILTKPFNLKRTVLYTIVDFLEDIRGTSNTPMYDFGDQEDCDQCLKDLQAGEIEISRRNRVFLDIIQIV